MRERLTAVFCLGFLLGGGWAVACGCALLTKQTASWGYIARDGSGLITTADGTLVLTGGWNTTSPVEFGSTKTTNQILKSTDNGATWTEVLAHDAAPPQTGVGQRWRRRHSHCTLTATLSGTQYIYVVGGDGFDTYYGGAGDGNGPYPTDVWRSVASTYGATWERMTATAEWGARALHMCWAIGSTFYVAGGQTCLLVSCVLHDVWKSTDAGATWTQLADAPWAGRGSLANALPTISGKAWLLGGMKYDSTSGNRVYFNDVWTFDGTSWVQVTASAPWTARGYHNTVAAGGGLWVVRGTSPTMLSDAWFTCDGVNWAQFGMGAGAADHASSAAVSVDGTTIVIAGGAGDAALGVWKITTT